MTVAARPFADSDNRTIVSAFAPAVESMPPTTTYFGLGMQVRYLYGHLAVLPATSRSACGEFSDRIPAADCTR